MKFITQKKSTIADKDYRTYHTLRWMSILSIIGIVTLAFIAGWFIYTNIYQTIGKTETILLLHNNPSFEPIQFNLYNRTTRQWEAKHTDKDLDIFYDPFYDVDLTVITTSTEATVTSTEHDPSLDILTPQR